MPSFGEYEVLPSHETAAAYGNDVLALCYGIGDRVRLVAENYAVAAPEIIARNPLTQQLGIVPAHLRLAIDARRQTLLQMGADMRTSLAEHPIETGLKGI